MKVLVLQGGNSPEREISIRSAKTVISGLQQLGIDYVVLDPADGAEHMISAAKECDIVLPILHGINGEDGAVQEILESEGIRFLGASSEVSKITIDKVKTHEHLERYGIVMPKYEVVTKESFLTSKLRDKPYVIKPIMGGSSIDTVIVRKDLEKAKKTVLSKLRKYQTMLLEELIEGIEISAPVLDNTALPLIQIVPPKGEEFDYKNKYNGKSQEICPVSESVVDSKTQKKVQDIVLKAHKLLGVRHLSRSEFILDGNNKIYMLELNTIPGLTKASLFPKAAQVAGISVRDLVERFVTMTAGEQ